MTRWIEDPSLEPPEDHRWMKPAPDDCPNCPCHTARVCEQQAWHQASRPSNADGTPYREPCPCQTAARTEDDDEDTPCGEGMCQCRCSGGAKHSCGCDCPHHDDCDCEDCLDDEAY